MPLMATGATVSGLYSHIAHSMDKEEGKIPPLFKGRNQNKPKVNLRNKERTHLKPKRQRKHTCMIAPTIIITMTIILPPFRIVATDFFMVKAVTDNLEVSHNETEAKDLNIINVNFRIIDFREVHFNRIILNTAPAANPIFREIKQIVTEAEVMAGSSAI